jgi:hypothetical protein
MRLKGSLDGAAVVAMLCFATALAPRRTSPKTLVIARSRPLVVNHEDHLPTAGCRYGRWSDPKEISDSDRDAGAIRFPSLAIGTSRTFVVGNDIPFFNNDWVKTNAVSIAEPGIGRLGGPNGRFLFAYPRAVVDQRNRLHIVWGEPDSMRRTPAWRWPGIRLTSLWHATREPAGGWTTPTLVFSAKNIAWDVDIDGQLSSDGAIEYVFPVLGETLGHARFQNEAWRTTRIPGTRGAIYPSVVTGPGSRVLVAYVAADSSRSGDINSVFMVESRDDGDTWLVPRLLSPSNGLPARETQLRSAPSGDLHMLWRQPLRSGATEVIRHVGSVDGGRTWSSPSDLTASDGFDGIRSAIDSCGTLHVVFQDWHGGGVNGHLDYARWEGKWSDAEHLFPSLVTLDPIIEPLGERGLFLVFLGSRAGASDTTPFRTFSAELRISQSR